MQLKKGPLSKLHAKVLLALLDVKVKDALGMVVVAGGPPVIVVLGQVRSIIHVKVAGVGSILPLVSVARTWNVCVPATKPVYVVGVVQPAKKPLSKLHAKVLLALVDWKVKPALVLLVVAGGLDVIIVSGVELVTPET
jgi:hypothetical protein